MGKDRTAHCALEPWVFVVGDAPGPVGFSVPGALPEEPPELEMVSMSVKRLAQPSLSVINAWSFVSLAAVGQSIFKVAMTISVWSWDRVATDRVACPHSA